ncbi:hypothetical protein HYS93_02360 [Candidatus Daviesbacteria bacterium]|nr:hypothetical protein [Candidatus Daviesbacteria bacterium]
MDEVIKFLPGLFLSIVLFHYLTHPKSSVRRKLPSLKKGPIEISPSIRFSLFGRTIWLHHWLNLLILLVVSIPLTVGFLDYTFTKGFLVGGIFQGLMYPDAGKIFFKNYPRRKKTV